MGYKHSNQPCAIMLSKQVHSGIKIICMWKILAPFIRVDEIMDVMSMTLLNNYKVVVSLRAI